MGSAFTLNEGGEFSVAQDAGTLGLVLGGGKINITGAWSGGSGNAEITGAAAGGTVSGVLTRRSNAIGIPRINMGTSSVLSLVKDASINIPFGGTIAMVGTVSSVPAATIYFGENTGIVFSGETGANPFPAGKIADVGSTSIVYGTAAVGGSLVSITSTSGGSIAAGTAHTEGYTTVNLTHQTKVE